MNKLDKKEVVTQLHTELDDCAAVFVTDYVGLNVAEVTALRSSIREAGGSYKVVKNTLLKLAADGTPTTELEDFFSGPTAIAIAQEDPLGVAKALVEFSKNNDKLELQGGVLGDKRMELADIEALATMPSKEVLLGKMLGSLNAPATNFVGVLSAMVRQMLYVLMAIEAKKQEQE